MDCTYKFEVVLSEYGAEKLKLLSSKMKKKDLILFLSKGMINRITRKDRRLTQMSFCEQGMINPQEGSRE